MQHAKKGGVRLTEEEQKQVVAFLKTLSDPTFVADKRFSRPAKR
jgi:cytochrome c1